MKFTKFSMEKPVKEYIDDYHLGIHTDEGTFFPLINFQKSDYLTHAAYVSLLENINIILLRDKEVITMLESEDSWNQ